LGVAARSHVTWIFPGEKGGGGKRLYEGEGDKAKGHVEKGSIGGFKGFERKKEILQVRKHRSKRERRETKDKKNGGGERKAAFRRPIRIGVQIFRRMGGFIRKEIKTTLTNGKRNLCQGSSLHSSPSDRNLLRGKRGKGPNGGNQKMQQRKGRLFLCCELRSL